MIEIIIVDLSVNVMIIHHRSSPYSVYCNCIIVTKSFLCAQRYNKCIENLPGPGTHQLVFER